MALESLDWNFATSDSGRLCVRKLKVILPGSTCVISVSSSSSPKRPSCLVWSDLSRTLAGLPFLVLSFENVCWLVVVLLIFDFVWRRLIVRRLVRCTLLILCWRAIYTIGVKDERSLMKPSRDGGGDPEWRRCCELHEVMSSDEQLVCCSH